MPENFPHCSKCDAPLSSPDDGGLCPKCLMKLGLADTAFGFTAAGFSPKFPADDAREFGPYRMFRLLGKGGMGSVYEAEDGENGRRVALKVLGQTLDTPELRARFLREGQLAASVRHPNVVGVLSAGEVDGTPVIAMELLHDGTLAERVKKHGPMPVAEAVDAALQIIDGLEAAHAAGVLHRDVKPANCFISTEGMVKVGDFGLSISTVAQLENSLTQSGTVLGTPAFAAPEQLRGEDIDARADIYGVGATLYYLLTGKYTHAADTLVAVIAAVLTKTPPAPHVLNPTVPTALSRVVMRCLERNKGRRYPDYAGLRTALERFRPGAPSPGMLGLRFVAGMVDVFIASIPLQLALAIPGVSGWSASREISSVLLWLAGTLCGILYFTLLEGRWGTTPGKLLCGLRVARATGGYPGYGRALFRSMLFYFDGLLAVAAAGAWILSGRGEAAFFLQEMINVLVFILMCTTMRRKNGFAMLHDLFSGTRVVVLPSPENDIAIQAREIVRPPEGEVELIGPFIVCRRHGDFIEAWDSSLLRPVWIVERAGDFPELSLRRRSLNRPGRLRWLQGTRGPEGNWDAFEAPAGQPLSAMTDRKQPWTRIRRWLLDLSTEFTASPRDGTRLDAIAFNRVWITSRGHAVWLDFPLPEPAVEYPVTRVRELQSFLAGIATACMAPQPPLHAMKLLETLGDQRLDSPEMVAGNLRATLGYTATLTRRRRLVTLVLWPLIAMMFSVISVFSFKQQIENDPSHPPAMSQVEMKVVISGNLSPEDREKAVGEMAEGIAFGFFDKAIDAPSAVFVVVFVPMLMAGGFVTLIWTVVTGVPPGLHLFGLVVVNRSGRQVSRWLAVVRTLFAGVATGLMVIGATLCGFAPAFHSWLLFSMGLVPLGIVLGIGIHAFLSPRRALVDLMTDTTIIPR